MACLPNKRRTNADLHGKTHTPKSVLRRPMERKATRQHAPSISTLLLGPIQGPAKVYHDLSRHFRPRTGQLHLN
eukprot:1998110-Prorocentrum_lima.AAC.1